MIKKTLFILILGAVFIVYSCSKMDEKQSARDDQKSNAKELTVTWQVQENVRNKTNSEGDPDEVTEAPPDDGSIGETACSQHGGATSTSRSWDIATCKSNCTSGIGFRCGGTWKVTCADGTVQKGIISSTCPPPPPPDTTTTTGNAISQPSNAVALNSSSRHLNEDRRMTAACKFYDNNTIKFIFMNKLPDSENKNDRLEVESTDFEQLPKGILIGGKLYKGYIAEKGSYKIDKKDGPFGSVIIRTKLVEQN